MKFSKILTKVIALGATGAMLFSAVANASTVKVPNMGSVAREYADLYSKSSVFGTLRDLTLDSYTRQCIAEATIDRAITNANLAASAITGVTYLDGSNKVYTGTLKGPQPANTYYLRDIGTISTVNGYLANASVGPVSMKFYKNFATLPGSASASAEYYRNLYLNVSVPLYPTGMQKYLVNFDGSSVVSSSDMSSFFSNYAVFLSSLKTFYRAAGCYTVTPQPPNTTKTNTTKINTTNKSDKKSNIKDAVITTQYTKIKQGTRFVIMDGVRAYDNGGRGADITRKVTISGSINTAVLGTYRITYSVKGGNGRTILKTVYYQVVKDIYQGGRYLNKY